MKHWMDKEPITQSNGFVQSIPPGFTRETWSESLDYFKEAWRHAEKANEAWIEPLIADLHDRGEFREECKPPDMSFPPLIYNALDAFGELIDKYEELLRVGNAEKTDLEEPQ